LHAKRSEQKGIVSSFDIEAVQRFHERLLQQYPRNRLIFRALRKETEIFAMFYGFRVADRLFYFQLGYDPAWSDSSPGLVLLSETIREAFQSGCVEYNFLQGDESFKSTWTKQTRGLHDFRIFSPSLRGKVYCELRHARFAARSVILRALRRVGSPGRKKIASKRGS
jgi:CelD/BcsL family acetyltransferase involved in cellulose biosynthesis